MALVVDGESRYESPRLYISDVEPDSVEVFTRVLALVADGSVAEPRFNSVDPRLTQKPGLALVTPPAVMEQIINTLLDVADGVIT